MKKLPIILLLLLCTATALYAETVSNVRVRQSGEDIEILYDLARSSTVSLYIATGNSEQFSLIENATGDVGAGITAGNNKRIIWSPLKSQDVFQAQNVRFRVEGLTPSQYRAAHAKYKSFITFNLGIIPYELFHRTGQPAAQKLSYGLMFGQVYSKAHTGWYISLQSNLHVLKDQNKVADYYRTYSDHFFNGKKQTSDFTINVGAIYQFIEHSKTPINHFTTLGVYLGAGYGFRRVAWETTDGGWIPYHNALDNDADDIPNAGCVQAGLIGSIKGFTLWAGACTLNFKKTEAQIGIGYMF